MAPFYRRKAGSEGISKKVIFDTNIILCALPYGLKPLNLLMENK
jgi:hypothetical protein